jgi:hypothetical protein
MTLRQIIEELPEEARREVQDFAKYLLQRRSAQPQGTPSFSWAGILADEDRQHSSVDLQHELLASRSGGLEFSSVLP